MDFTELSLDVVFKNVSKPEGVIGNEFADSMIDGHENLIMWGLEHVTSFIPNKDRELKILDVGCGGGSGILFSSRFYKNAEFFAIDHSAEMAEKTGNVKLDGLQKISAFHGTVEKLPFEDNSMDLVLCVETTYFWPDLGKGLKEIKRVLKDDGIIAVINEGHIYDNYKDVICKEMIELEKHNMIKLETENGYENVFKAADFENVKTETKTNNGWIVISGVA